MVGDNGQFWKVEAGCFENKMIITIRRSKSLSLRAWKPGPKAPRSLEAWKPGSLEAWKPGSLEAWKPGSLEAWKPGSLEAWKPGSLEAWKPGSLEAWKPGSLEAWKPGSLEAWKPGSLEAWKPGSLEAWKPGSLEVWKSGSLEAWKPGSLEAWKPGSLEAWKPGSLEAWKPGSLEAWKPVRLEAWKPVRLEAWKPGSPPSLITSLSAPQNASRHQDESPFAISLFSLFHLSPAFCFSSTHQTPFKMPCPPLTFLESPDGLITICHLITIIELPLDILGAYCIIAKTPRKMKNVKLSLLILHFLTIQLDVTIGFLLIPYLILPSLSGWPLGILASIGVPIGLQIYIGFTFTALVGAGILALFENRYHRLFPNYQWEKLRKFYLFANYFLALTYCLYPLLWVPEQEIGRKHAEKQVPCATNIPGIEFQNLYVLATSPNSIVTICTFTLSAYSLQIIALFLIIVRNLITKYKNLSASTYQIQKKFLIAITAQFFVTVLLILFPAGLVVFSILTDSYNQARNNMCFIILSFYGFVSTIVMITFHQPYREWVLSVLSVKKREIQERNYSNPIDSSM